MPNRLASATSPYLLQHQHNPVDWWEWGQDAFAEARRRDVPVLLSVGYGHEVSGSAAVGGCRRILTEPQLRGGVVVRVGPARIAVGHRFRGLMHHSRASLGSLS